MGSNPIPRAILRDLHKSVYKHKTDRGLRKNEELPFNKAINKNNININTHLKIGQEETQQELISRKVDAITKT